MTTPRLAHWLLLGAWLSLPIAHFRPISAIPLYTSEYFIIGALLVTIFTGEGRARFQAALMRWPQAFFLSLLFMSGAGIALVINRVPWHAVGLMKSFVVIPVLFLWLNAWWLNRESTRPLLMGWWGGAVAAALAGLGAALTEGLTYDGRLASGLYLSPNEFAMLLSPAVFFGVYQWRESAKGWPRFFWASGTLLMVSALFLTQSYAALGALIISLFWLIRPSFSFIRQYGVGFLFVVIISSAGLYLMANTEKFTALAQLDERSSLMSRLMIWRAALVIAQEHFPWGIGLGQFQRAYLEHQPLFPPYLEWAVPEPHNLILSVYLATGVIGLGALTFFVGWVMKRLRQSLARSDVTTQPIVKVYLAILSWWLLVGLVDTPLFRHDPSLMIFGILGLSLAMMLPPSQQPLTAQYDRAD